MRSILLILASLGIAAGSLAYPGRFQPQASLVPGAAPSYSNRIILIRHAEKGTSTTKGAKAKSKGKHSDLDSDSDSAWPQWPFPGGGGKMPNGLSDKGKERAQYLRTLFGNESDYDFGLVFAAPRTPEEKDEERTYATVAPVAADLGLEINIACANAPASCVVDYIEEFTKTSDKDILISWKHFDLNIIATALGAPNAKKTYPDKRNDLIWIMYDGVMQEKRSQHCPGLDDARVDEGDPDLVVEDWSRSLATGSSEQIVF